MMAVDSPHFKEEEKCRIASLKDLPELTFSPGRLLDVALSMTEGPGHLLKIPAGLLVGGLLAPCLRDPSGECCARHMKEVTGG